MFPLFAEMPFTYLTCGLLMLSGIIGFYYKPYYQALIFHPYEVFKGRRVHSLLSSAFVHKDWLHLLINIYIFFGAIRDVEYIILEDDFNGLIIKVICFVILVGSIVLSNLWIGWKEKTNISFTSVGFSSAVFGFLSFSLIYLPLDQPKTINQLIPMNYAFEYAGVLFLVLGLMVVLFRKSRTNHKAHLIGFMIGLVIAFIIKPVLVVEIYNFLF